jgi:hypothetical protein
MINIARPCERAWMNYGTREEDSHEGLASSLIFSAMMCPGCTRSCRHAEHHEVGTCRRLCWL